MNALVCCAGVDPRRDTCFYGLNLDKGVIEIPHRISVRTILAVRVPVSKELEPVVCFVVDLIVLPPRGL